MADLIGQRRQRQLDPLGLEARALAVEWGTVMPLFQLIERHVLAAERLHSDDTIIRILAKGKCATGRIWTYTRDYAHPTIMRSSPGHLSSFLRQISEMVAGIQTRRCA